MKKNGINKMFKFSKKMFITTMNAVPLTFVGYSTLNAIPFKCVSMNN